jgi:hypothetical protein
MFRENPMFREALAISILLAAGVAAVPAQAQNAGMSFFVSSRGSGEGGNLGGLAGADKLCQTLAAEAGAGAKTWRAYLSSQATGGTPAVHAKDRIGNGPWTNAKGVVIAKDVADLHSPANKISKDTALDEKGNPVKGRGDSPVTHDMLTGSQQDGTAMPGPDDATCSNWTSSVDGQGGAMVGHHDLVGTASINTWNFSHKTPGCSPANLAKVGGAGLFYCFAVN